ncbi:MAG TPA: class I adenylate-forming enzyme family protein [Candidatus Hydrogenedentes bacterium]|nr:class I adenylate-forming enzyme family protein [Candidatus Hydrogenedentota bacterium]HOL77899.1 class I adenylate-forming enzyme family protein [Candidatus Hydrogenedentota bacterium]HPO87131.1 class I adenylate-forming enzyme family protein [Candidatus Hydrogenedentota bacterium]
MVISELLDKQAKVYGEKPLIISEDGIYSYVQMAELSATVAENLARMGLQKGSKVVLLMGNCMEFLFAFLGLGRIGAVAVPINPVLKRDEIVYILTDSDADALICVPEFSSQLEDFRAASPSLKHVIVTGDAPGNAMSFKELMKPTTIRSHHEAHPQDDACLIYTSGTTGAPKGVMLTHSNYLWNARMLVRGVDVTEADRFFCVLPLFHVNAQVVSLLTPLMAGGSTVLMKKFNPFAILPMIEEHKVTLLSAVPTIYNVMARIPRADQFDISSIRIFASGAAPLPEETFRLVQNVFHRDLIMGYGLTEATCASAVANPLDPVKWDSVGSPLPYTRIRLVDEKGVDVPDGETGEIIIAGPTVMKGYYKKPEATAATIRNGWLYTGDLGRFDEEGYLFIVGRVKDMIIRGGMNIYPQEVENVISRIPGVEECCVVGIEEPRWGQEVLALIKTTDGTSLSEEEIIRTCRERLAAYKCPRHVRFLDSFPKTATGKIKKNELVARFSQKL